MTSQQKTKLVDISAMEEDLESPRSQKRQFRESELKPTELEDDNVDKDSLDDPNIHFGDPSSDFYLENVELLEKTHNVYNKIEESKNVETSISTSEYNSSFESDIYVQDDSLKDLVIPNDLHLENEDSLENSLINESIESKITRGEYKSDYDSTFELDLYSEDDATDEQVISEEKEDSSESTYSIDTESEECEVDDAEKSESDYDLSYDIYYEDSSDEQSISELLHLENDDSGEESVNTEVEENDEKFDKNREQTDKDTTKDDDVEEEWEDDIEEEWEDDSSDDDDLDEGINHFYDEMSISIYLAMILVDLIIFYLFLLTSN